MTQLPLPGTDFVLSFRGTVERYRWVPGERCWEDDQERWWWVEDVEMLARVIRLPRLRSTVVQRASQEAGARICAERQSMASDATGQSASRETELCGADCDLSE